RPAIDRRIVQTFAGMHSCLVGPAALLDDHHARTCRGQPRPWAAVHLSTCESPILSPPPAVPSARACTRCAGNPWRPRRCEMPSIVNLSWLPPIFAQASERLNLGELAGGATVWLAVTGLSRSGKTVFITSLVHNLLSSAHNPNRMPLLGVVG